MYFRALCDANMVTSPYRFGGNKTVVDPKPHTLNLPFPRRHNLEDGDLVQISGVDGMEGLDTLPPMKVTVRWDF